MVLRCPIHVSVSVQVWKWYNNSLVGRLKCHFFNKPRRPHSNPLLVLLIQEQQQHHHHHAFFFRSRRTGTGLYSHCINPVLPSRGSDRPDDRKRSCQISSKECTVQGSAGKLSSPSKGKSAWSDSSFGVTDGHPSSHRKSSCENRQGRRRSIGKRECDHGTSCRQPPLLLTWSLTPKMKITPNCDQSAVEYVQQRELPDKEYTVKA